MSQNAFQFAVHDLMHQPGAMREIQEDIVLPEALGEGIASVPQGTKIELDLRLESVHEGILATGELFSEAKSECSRCLEPLQLPVEVDFQELFAYSLSQEDDFVVTDEKIDLEQVIRDAVVLNLPFHPLCKPDCQGLCAECGVKLADNPNHVHEAAIDSRWSALEQLQTKED